MTTAVTETLREVEIFRHQGHMIRAVVQRNLDGITQEESLIQPSEGNCLNWVMGHLLSVYNAALPMLGQERVMPENVIQRYDRGSSPIQNASEALDLREILAAWEEATQRIDAGLAGLTEEALDQPAPHSPSGNPKETVRSLLNTICFHQAYHAGQTGLLRRVAGKEGAIR